VVGNLRRGVRGVGRAARRGCGDAKRRSGRDEVSRRARLGKNKKIRGNGIDAGFFRRARRRVRRLESRVCRERTTSSTRARVRGGRASSTRAVSRASRRVPGLPGFERPRIASRACARAPSPRVALVLCGVRVPTAPDAALAFPARDDGGTFFMCCSACSAISSSAFPRGDSTGGG
jgi:hypothetical protein